MYDSAATDVIAPNGDAPTSLPTSLPASATKPLRIGPLTLPVPVVLAPMAGVTNSPYRTLCRQYGAGLYVSEMVQSRALLEGSERTMRMVRFGADETPRSIQLYGTDPVIIAAAVRKLVDEIGVQHIDMNFGCPMPKVTRHGGGSAVPAKPRLLQRIVRSAVAAAGDVPLTLKFRIGLHDDLVTFLDTGRIAEAEGAAAISLHARTTAQLYSGSADWAKIAELKQAVTTIPVLGNGDIWEAADALKMMAATGCDGVVIGRGCLGRPWLFGDLVDVFNNPSHRPVAPRFGVVAEVMRTHVRLLCEHFASERGVRDFRRHAGWYLTGYPVGAEVRHRIGLASTIFEVDEILAGVDPTIELTPGGERFARGHTRGPQNVVLPHGYLDHLDDDAVPSAQGETESSGG